MGKTLCVISLIVANPSTDHLGDEAAWKIWDTRRWWRQPPHSHSYTILEPLPKRNYSNRKVGEVLKHDPNRLSLVFGDLLYKFKTRCESNPDFEAYVAKPPPVMPSKFTNANGLIKIKVRATFDGVISPHSHHSLHSSQLSSAPALPPPLPSTQTTLIFTSLSLFGQWEDEIKRFAPSLVVRRHHGSGHGTGDQFLRAGRLGDCDVILSSPHRRPDDYFFHVEWHRIVVDESHENISPGGSLHCTRRWCCTLRFLAGSMRICTDVHFKITSLTTDTATLLCNRGHRLRPASMSSVVRWAFLA